MISFGWKLGDVRESYWIGDPALVEVSAAARAAWEVDGDASHLEPFIKNGKATRVVFRSLSPDETRVAQSPLVEPSNEAAAWRRAAWLAFRMGVSFPDDPDEVTAPDGKRHKIIIREGGIDMLAIPFVRHLEIAYPGLVAFYGEKVLSVSMPGLLEKKPPQSNESQGD
jgi:hypothetical protein